MGRSGLGRVAAARRRGRRALPPATAVRGARRHRMLSRAVVAAETIRLRAGLAYALLTYFGRAQPPDARLLRGARTVAPARAVGLIAACGGSAASERH